MCTHPEFGTTGLTWSDFKSMTYADIKELFDIADKRRRLTKEKLDEAKSGSD